MEREFAFDNLYSKPNSEVRLREKIETLEKGINDLQEEINVNLQEYKSWKDLQSLNSELRDYEVFALSHYSDVKVLNPQFSGKVNLYYVNFYSDNLYPLQERIIQNIDNFSDYDDACSNMARDNFIVKTNKKGRKEIDARHTLEFKDGKASHENKEIKIIGGLSYIGLKGYLIQSSQSLSYANKIAITQRRSEALKNLDHKRDKKLTIAPGSFIYESHKRLSSFIRPGMFCITEAGRPDRNKLIYNIKFIDSIE